jgi:hypothetical protein
MNLTSFQKTFNADTVIDTGNLASFTGKFSEMAKENYTASMVAEAEKKLYARKESLANLQKLTPIVKELHKNFVEHYKLILECLKSGFESEQQKMELTTNFANSYNEFKKALASMMWGFGEQSKQASGYFNSYRR